MRKPINKKRAFILDALANAESRFMSDNEWMGLTPALMKTIVKSAITEYKKRKKDEN